YGRRSAAVVLTREAGENSPRHAVTFSPPDAFIGVDAAHCAVLVLCRAVARDRPSRSPPGRERGMRRTFVTLVAIGLLVLAVAPVAAAPPTPGDPAGHGKALGVVPAKNQASHRPGSANNLSYHGGPVMQTNAVYALYWAPGGAFAGSANYQNVIDGFFTNVAKASGSTSNVYDSDTQYTNAAGAHIAYISTFTGAIVDTNAFPANGCTDRYTSVCLTDAQISAEINAVIAARGLPRG